MKNEIEVMQSSDESKARAARWTLRLRKAFLNAFRLIGSSVLVIISSEMRISA